MADRSELLHAQIANREWLAVILDANLALCDE
ncbi:MAG: hypothetical protein ACI9UA_005470, partial [Pseudoalteromonas tetraodonis]